MIILFQKYLPASPFLLSLLLIASSSAQIADSDSAAITPLTAQRTVEKADIDTVITYQAKEIHNSIKNRKTIFTGDAVVKYKNMTLQAAKITLDWDKQLLTAEPDSQKVWTKKDSTSTDSVLVTKWVGEPVLIEGSSQMVGAKMTYNYKTEKGRVIRGRTEFEGGNYLGEQIKRVDKETFNVSHSTYTTCDLDSNPHFHFEARRMKMIVNDKVIAKPIVMYLGNIPVMALPFAVFPHRTGRQSGILIPRYGQSFQEGRFFRDLGYYWAPSDHFDARAMVDFFERTGWMLHGGANYAVRYLLNGSLSGSITRKNFVGDAKSRRWDLRVYHNQEIDPTSRFAVNGFFVSDKNFYKNLSTNIDTRLTRELRSNATYSKNWPSSKTSLSINVSQVRDLQEETTQTTLPQLSFRKSQSQIFAPKREPGRGRGRAVRREPKWYEFLYYSYNSSLLNSRNEYYRRTLQDTVKEVKTRRLINHDASLTLSSPQKYFGWMAVNHSLNVSEDWFDRTFAYSYDEETRTVVSRELSGFAARHTFDYSASANTKIYGVIAPGIGDIQLIRHVVTPSLSFLYQPDFSGNFYGYFVSVQRPDGQVERRDRFSGTPTGGNKLVNMSIRNLFQMKRGVGEKEKKIDLFTMDLNTGYNFKAPQFRLSDLRSYWQANPARNFSLSASSSHSFYVFDKDLKRRVNRYLFEDDGWKRASFLRLTTFQVNFSLRLQGEGGKALEQEPDQIGDPNLPQEEEDVNILEEDILSRRNRFNTERTFRSYSIPWRVNLNFNFSLDKSRNPDNPEKRYYVDISGAELNLTKNWRLGYNAHYDIAKNQVVYHRMTIYRNLHCWEAMVDWVPSGPGRRVFFRINVKAPTLRDIKLERHGGAPSVLGY